MEKVFTQEQVTDIQISILEKIEQIHTLGWNAFVLNCMQNKEATQGSLTDLLNTASELIEDLKTDIKIETSTV
ncbi:MAG: hypothetical protein RR290_00595 [Clostridia bacterium]